MNEKKKIALVLCILLISLALLACGEGSTDRKVQSNTIPRFTNPDGALPGSDSVVLDNLTGLIWIKDDNCTGDNYPAYDDYKTAQDGLVSYKDAISFIEGLNKGKYPKCSYGYSDWRLPTKRELKSLLPNEDKTTTLWLNRRNFVNIQADRYWFSAGDDHSSIGKWFFTNMHPYLKVDGCYVWPVREERRKFRDGIVRNQGK